MTRFCLIACSLLLAATAQAQIQVELKFKRLQYIAYEPLIATLTITNLAGRDVELHDDQGVHWFGFEVNAGEGNNIVPSRADAPEPPLKVEAGKSVIRRIDLTPVYPIHDYGAYHVRANVFFADLNKYFYSQTKVVQVTEARAIWQKTVGVPEGLAGAGGVRSYSLMSNRLADHTSLHVRVEDRTSGVVYCTYSLGHAIAFEEPTAEVDRGNVLHVLHCAAPRTWTYSRVGLNGEFLGQRTILETKTRPRLHHSADGSVAVNGGMVDEPIAQSARVPAQKLSARPGTRPPARPTND